MAAIVVTSLADTGATVSRPSQTPKKSLRGAAGGVYVGPIISKAAIKGPSTPTHAVGPAAGGVEDSTSARESDTYDASGSTGGGTGFGDASVTTVTRPNPGSVAQRVGTAYIADGVQGGSTPGRPISSGNHVASGGGYGGGGAFDKRSTRHESVPVGQRRKTFVNDETVTDTDLPRPTTGVAADPAAGTVALVQGALKLQVDLHADDITGGANGRKGAEIALFARGTDTDTDGDLVGIVSADGGTDITDAFTGLAAATTYVFYARWRKADGNGKVQVGPWSARATVATA